MLVCEPMAKKKRQNIEGVDIVPAAMDALDELADTYGSKAQIVRRTLEFLRSAPPAVHQVLFARRYVVKSQKPELIREISAYFAGLMEDEIIAGPTPPEPRTLNRTR